MEDRFKFRFWDKNRQKMETYEHNLSSLGIILASNNPDKIPMQCTGSKDKNGKLIYEGDVRKTDDGRLFVVFWNDEILAYCLKQDNKDENICAIGKRKEPLNIIGNIYENPELLEEKEWKGFY